MNGKPQHLIYRKKRAFFYKPLILFLLLFTGPNLSGQPNGSQNFSIRNATMAEAVEQILHGTQYRVIYSVDDLDEIKTVNMDLRNTTVLTALRQLLQQNSLTYSLRDENTIVISRIETQTPPQRVTARGRVVDSNGKPLRGVSVMVEGTKHGTATDANGLFEIVAERGQTLVFSYLGMQTQRSAIDSQFADMMIGMKVAAAEQLEEVVVTGYSTTTKTRTPGSVAVLTAEDIQGSPLQSLDMLMQGKVAGVNVQAVSGRPGESAEIRIRGTNTLTGNAEPLWVVNGVPLEKDIPVISSSNIRSGDFSSLYMDGIAGINPEDIESITILKDASAAAIYGARAAGGVIVVTTKRGKEGKMKVNYSSSVSLTTKPVRAADLMNSAEKLQFEQELWDEFSKESYLYNQTSTTKLNVPIIGITGQVRSGYGKYAGWTEAQQDEYLASLAANTTDWFDELFRNSVSTKHHISLSGGGDKSNYYVSLGYNNLNGLLKNNYTDSYSINSTLGINAAKNLRIDFLTSIGYQKAREPSQGTNVFLYAYYANPYESPYNEDGSYREDETYYKFRDANGVTNMNYPDNGFNLMRELNETSTVTKNFSASETIQLTWNFHNDFSFSGMGSFFYSNHNSENINGANTYTAFLDRPFEGNDAIYSQRKYGSITQTATQGLGYTLRGQFNYDRMFGGDKHYVTALAGAEISSQQSNTIYSKRYGYDPVTGGSVSPTPPSSANPESDITSLLQLMDGLTGQYIDEQAMASFYFDADYTYDRRYTVKFSFRTDGSNNFGQKQQFNPIWSAGFSWNLMQEQFANSLDNIFSQLIFRSSLGYTGNINRNIYPKLVLKYTGVYRYVDNDYLRLGSVTGAPNPNLGWEKTFDYKFNLDMGFLKNRFTLSLEYYNKLSTRVVSTVLTVSTTGFTRQGYNTSTIANRGFEVSMGAQILKSDDYSLSVFANGAYNSNKLLKYDAPSVGYDGKYVGYPTDALFAGEYIGINPYNGMYEFKPRSDAEFNKDNDYKLRDNYLYYLGPQTAPYTGGFGISGSYKNFTASLSGSFSIGNKVINSLSPITTYSYFDRFKPGGPSGTTPQTVYADLYALNYNILREQHYRWTTDNPVTDGYPRIVDPYTGIKVDGKSYMSDDKITNAALLEDISYVKFSSISLSYKLGERMLEKIKLNSAEISFMMNNLFTISTYKGIDPETPGAIYPQSKSFSLALRIGF